LDKNAEILGVSEKRWSDAQEFEGSLWVRSNQRNSYLKILAKFVRVVRNHKVLFNYLKYRDFYCGDDWNYWWMEQFENYRRLPKSVERVLETGCGPYTNIRLISKNCKIKEIYCCDPLIDVYKGFKLTWLSTQVSKGRINISNDKCENLKFDDTYFDLLVCINVLDHVQNAKKCLKEVNRVIKQGGFIVFGQDLSNDEDLQNREVIDDVGHPIKIHHTTLDIILDSAYGCHLKKILPRDKGRNPIAHYGTYIFIGQKE
jgi:ubiquinone/menaquinone biosynthesis C-methylase UbiE